MKNRYYLTCILMLWCLFLVPFNKASCFAATDSEVKFASPVAVTFDQLIGEVVSMDSKSNSLTVLEKCKREYFTVSINQGTSFRQNGKNISLQGIKVGQKAILRYNKINDIFVAREVIIDAEYTPTTCAATPEVIGSECVAVIEGTMHEDFRTEDIIAIQTDEGQKELILLMALGRGDTSLVALLRRPNGCDIVLSTAGSGIEVQLKKGKIYPDLYSSDSEGGVTYFWNGKNYEDVTLKKRMAKGKKLNEKALKLFGMGKIEEAIDIWNQIRKEPDVANAEVMNNLGFAYYTLGKETKDTMIYSHDVMESKPKKFTYYEKAEFYLRDALEKEPERWSALLNMGDLEYEQNDYVWAIKRYDKLLKVKPDYKYADIIRKRIEEMKNKPEEIGGEVVVTSYPTGEKDITYRRIDGKNIVRQGYSKSGQLRFSQNIVDGYENGKYQRWFEAGQLAEEGQKKMGKEIGKYIYYNPDGSIRQIKNFNEDGTSVDVTKENIK